ncbi:MAG: hypothetical protein ACRCYY_17155 [Trueperaceae bacterium]
MLEVDVIEEGSSFGGETLVIENLPAGSQVQLFQGTTLEKTGEGYVLPSVKGRLLLEVLGYFKE